MNVLNKTETDAAHRLIQGGSRPEDQVRQDIVRVLDGLAIESLLTYPTEAGPADIYLPRRRVFIEVKAAGLATYPLQTHGRGNQETPFEQVKRYLLAEMDEELGRLFPSEQNDMPWTGIVTDGRVWHAWRFPHKPNTEEKYILGGFIPQNEDELLRRVIPIIESETVGKLWIPPDPLDLFKSYLGGLQEIYKDISNSNSRVRKATETKKHLWLDILRGSGMAPEREYAQDDLFIAHCFLVALSRGVVHTLITDDDPDPNRLFRDGYLAWTIEVESGRKWAQRLLDRIHSYDWRRTKGDVLRPLYEGLVSARDRRDFGEVYTPDWLAEMMVKDVLDDEWCNQAVSTALAVSHGESMPGGIGVLDPTCGSGTFLYHCAKRILASKNAKTLPPVQRSDVVCRLVSGIDIHPVAVEFARATLLRALPAPPSMDLAGLAIYQGDCLMLRQTDKRSLFAPTDGEVLITSPLGREIRIPREFSDHPGFPDMLGRLVEAALHGDPVPEDIRKIMKNVERQIFMCHAALAEIIEEEGNSVWTWYIKNVLGPDRLARRKVNRIVANPPWVKMANIQEPRRKRQLERVAGKDGTEYARLWVGGPQAPHFDIAQLFIYHARSIYLDRPQTDPAAWVAKASAIRGGNWKKFRKLHEKHCAQFLDFSSVKVFGGGDARRSCVIFEVRRSSVGEDVEIKAKYKNETLLPSMSWREVSRFLDWTKPECFEKKRSEYTPEQWRQGATITPKVLTVVDKKWGGAFWHMERDDCKIRQSEVEDSVSQIGGSSRGMAFADTRFWASSPLHDFGVSDRDHSLWQRWHTCSSPRKSRGDRLLERAG